MTRRLSLSLLTLFLVLGSPATEAVSAVVRVKAKTGTSQKQKASTKSALKKNKKQRDLLRNKEAEAETRATKEVNGWSAKQMRKFGFEPGQKEQAIKVRSRQLMGRTDRRTLRTLELSRGLLKKEAKLEKKIEKSKKKGNEKKAKELSTELAKIQGERHSIETSGALNKKLGVEKQIPHGIKSKIQRIKFLEKNVPGLKRDRPGKDGEVVAKSTYRKPRKAKRISGDSLYKGPWWKAESRPERPDANTILTLKDFRSLDADGMHASSFVTNPKTGEKWKLKFPGKVDKPHDPEATMSRLYYAMGYHTQPVYHHRDVKVDANVVTAAYKHRNKVGFRIPEKGIGKQTAIGSFLRTLGLPPGKYGYSPHNPFDLVAGALTKEGKNLSAKETRSLLKKGLKKPELLNGLKYVKLEGVNLMYKSGKDSSIGPWSPDAAQHINRQEVRMVSIIANSWAGAHDVRFPNLRQDVREKKSGGFELKHKLSDSGGALKVNKLGWEVNIKKELGLNHNDANLLVFKGLDRTTRNDAKAGVELLANLSRSQIVGAVAAGATSYPVAKLVLAKLISRRNSLVKEFGLVEKYGLLKVETGRKANIQGGGSFVLRDHKGKVTETIKIPQGSFVVRDGMVVDAPAS